MEDLILCPNKNFDFSFGEYKFEAYYDLDADGYNLRVIIGDTVFCSNYIFTEQRSQEEIQLEAIYFILNRKEYRFIQPYVTDKIYALFGSSIYENWIKNNRDIKNV